MALFDMFRSKDRKKPVAGRKDSRRRAFRKDEKPEELPSGMKVKDTETRVTGTRRPNESQEMKAKKASIPAPKAAPKIPKIDVDGKAKTGPADMMRRESATAAGMVAEKNPKSIAEARRKGSDTFIGKDGMKKAAVTKEELEASGYKTLREYLNAKNREKKKPAMKKGGNVAKYTYGGKVRGAGIAKKGVKPCKMR